MKLDLANTDTNTGVLFSGRKTGAEDYHTLPESWQGVMQALKEHPELWDGMAATFAAGDIEVPSQVQDRLAACAAVYGVEDWQTHTPAWAHTEISEPGMGAALEARARTMDVQPAAGLPLVRITPVAAQRPLTSQ